MKPLEALENLKNLSHDVQYASKIPCIDNELEVIEKVLKALEIIKEKPLVAVIDYHYDTYEEWLSACSENSDFVNFDSLLIKTEEEYDLLKEVLL